MSLFILHEVEVDIEAWRHAIDEMTAAWVDYIDEQRAGLRAWFDACWGEPIREMARRFALDYLARLRREEERRNRKRRRAARARCGRRR